MSPRFPVAWASPPVADLPGDCELPLDLRPRLLVAALEKRPAQVPGRHRLPPAILHFARERELPLEAAAGLSQRPCRVVGGSPGCPGRRPRDRSPTSRASARARSRTSGLVVAAGRKSRSPGAASTLARSSGRPLRPGSAPRRARLLCARRPSRSRRAFFRSSISTRRSPRAAPAPPAPGPPARSPGRSGSPCPGGPAPRRGSAAPARPVRPFRKCSQRSTQRAPSRSSGPRPRRPRAASSASRDGGVVLLAERLGQARVERLLHLVVVEDEAAARRSARGGAALLDLAEPLQRRDLRRSPSTVGHEHGIELEAAARRRRRAGPAPPRRGPRPARCTRSSTEDGTWMSWMTFVVTQVPSGCCAMNCPSRRPRMISKAKNGLPSDFSAIWQPSSSARRSRLEGVLEELREVLRARAARATAAPRAPAASTFAVHVLRHARAASCRSGGCGAPARPAPATRRAPAPPPARSGGRRSGRSSGAPRPARASRARRPSAASPWSSGSAPVGRRLAAEQGGERGDQERRGRQVRRSSVSSRPSAPKCSR